MELEIIHDRDEQKFFTVVNGKESHLTYSLWENGVINFNHTYVPNELRGQGIAAQIVKTGLDYAKENNLKIIPSCSYVDAYFRRHKEYQDLLREN